MGALYYQGVRPVSAPPVGTDPSDSFTRLVKTMLGVDVVPRTRHGDAWKNGPFYRVDVQADGSVGAKRACLTGGMPLTATSDCSSKPMRPQGS
jgi:hypothetical protein